MKYAMLIHYSPAIPTRCPRTSSRRCSANTRRSEMTPGMSPAPSCSRSRPPRRCACRTAGRLSTDGPFANTKEVFGGYYVFEADNLDEAIELAARIPAARLGGAIEVRPLVER